MKSLKIILTAFIIFFISSYTSAQFDLEKKLKKKVNKELNKAADDTIDKTVDVIKKGGAGEDEKESNSKQNKTSEKNVETESNENANDEPVQKELKVWSKYDFVPGDKVIFEDNLAGEESGEFPSRWDLLSGSAEVASLSGVDVIHFTNNNSIIIPLMDKKDFLSDVFTIEFDVFFETEGTHRSDIYKVRFYEGTGNTGKVDGKRKIEPIEIRWDGVRKAGFGGKMTDHREEKQTWQPKWRHISIAFNERSLKVYMDEERLINLPNLGYKPKMFSIGGHFDERFIKMNLIKDIRVNEGGKKLYDRILAEGKFTTRGILFDVNKSTIKGESMGTINEIVALMNEHGDLNFSIEGHTDSDGEDSFNQKLSEDRSTAVKNMLIKLGIDPSRLKSKGFGESTPLDNSNTPEGKANNRRVEFIKL